MLASAESLYTLEVMSTSLPASVLNHIGKRFGKLTVVDAFPVRLPGGKLTYKVNCQCDCGVKKATFLNALTQGRTVSCKCDKSRYQKMSGNGHYKFNGHMEIRGTSWAKWKRGAESRSLSFELTIESAWDLFEKQGRRCALSGVPISFGKSARPSATTASLDRIDNAKGYVEGNVQWVHKTVNLMRNTLSIDEFIEWCGWVAAATRTRLS